MIIFFENGIIKYIILNLIFSDSIKIFKIKIDFLFEVFDNQI